MTRSAWEREISAGGVVVRRLRGRWWVAAIRPQGKPAGTWALPKGLVEPGEPALATALREAAEETGLAAALVAPLGETRYVYTRGGTRVLKLVRFFLLRATGGAIGRLPAGMEREVAEARWLPLEEAPRLLAYRGEREVAERALRVLAGDAL